MTALSLIDTILFKSKNLVASFGKTAFERCGQGCPDCPSKAWPPSLRLGVTPSRSRFSA